MKVLEQVKVNNVIGVTNIWHTPIVENVFRVIKVRDLTKDPLAKSTIRRHGGTNSKVLVIGQGKDGRLHSFYSNSSTQIARLIPSIKKAYLSMIHRLPRKAQA